MENGRVEAIWIKRVKRGPMDAVEQAEMITPTGIGGKYQQCQPRRSATGIYSQFQIQRGKSQLLDGIKPNLNFAGQLYI